MSLRALLDAGRYHAYAYAYPHKTAWGPLDPPVPLRDAWADEDRANLSLYLHVPFCEQRCGFCNLFTQVQPAADAVRTP
jgi:oxygen-independent coproporphyrinogen-3 oxidase